MHNRSVRVLVWFLMVVVGFIMLVLAGPAGAETDQNPAWPCVAAPTHGILHCDTPDTTAPTPKPATKVVSATPQATPTQAPEPIPASNDKSGCDVFDVRKCMVESACTFGVMACKHQERVCRDLKATHATSTSAPAPTLHQEGEWVQYDAEYAGQGQCYIVNGKIVTCENAPTPETPPVVEPSPAATPVQKRVTPDCRNRVNENHPDCRP